jgi:membrane glycosyltransferase
MRRKVHASGPAPVVDPIPTTAQPVLPPATDDDWTVEALDRIDGLIEKVRSNSTDRLVRAGRIVVFGLLIAIMGITTIVLATIALVRGLDEAIPEEVWLVYLLLGAIFVVAGAFLWSKKSPKPQT